MIKTNHGVFGILLLTMLRVPAIGEEGEDKDDRNVAGLVDKLKTPNRGDVGRAAWAIAKQRNETIQGLIEIIEKRIGSWPARGTMETAARLLGRFRAKEAIPVLIENIDYRPIVDTSPGIDDVRPCVDALIEIGNPAAEAILEEHLASPTKKWPFYVKDLSPEERSRHEQLDMLPFYLKVLKGVWGSKVCLFLLKDKLGTDLTPQERANIQAALEHPIFKENKAEEPPDEPSHNHNDHHDDAHGRDHTPEHPGPNSPPPGRDDGDTAPQRPQDDDDHPDKGHDNSPPPGKSKKGE